MTTNKQNTAKQLGNKKVLQGCFFLDSAQSTKERLEYEVVLQDGATYTKTEADKLVAEWKQKGVEA